MKNWSFINGWSSKTALVNSVFCLMTMNLLMITSPSQAEEPETLPMDFLEFLGEGMVVEDEYLDPLNYADIDQDVTARTRIESTIENKTGEVKTDEE